MSTVGQIFQESKVWISIVCAVAVGSMAWQVMADDVDSNTKKNAEQDTYLNKLNEAIAKQNAISARIEQKVDYIREDVKERKEGRR